MTGAPEPPRYHQIEMLLAQRIKHGEYENKGLPGERALAAELGVARVTIRHALERLAFQGLVIRKHRSGTTSVPRNVIQQSRQLLHNHLDDFIQRSSLDTRVVLKYEMEIATPFIAESLELMPGSAVLKVVRVRTSNGVPVAYTEAYVPENISSHVTRSSLKKKTFVQVLQDLGIRIGMAEQSISSEAATELVHRALKVPPHSPVLKLERLLRDEAQRPIQISTGWYRSEHFAFRMRLSKMDDATRVWVDYQ